MKRLFVFCASIVVFSVSVSDKILAQAEWCSGFSSLEQCNDWCWEEGVFDFDWINNCLDSCDNCAWECSESSPCSTGNVCYNTQCVECSTDSHCGSIQICQSHTCIYPECLDDADCGPNKRCIGGTCVKRYTPVLISIQNSRFELTSWQDGVDFDIDADGLAERTAWTAAGIDDAFLAMDRNGNGRIDDATELFGDQTIQEPSADPNGFWALARLDALDMGGDGDGLLTAEDTAFPELLLWFDTNRNGISEAVELLPLSLFATAIDLDYRMQQRVDQHGNSFRYSTKVHQRDGGVRMAYDVIFFAVER